MNEPANTPSLEERIERARRGEHSPQFAQAIVQRAATQPVRDYMRDFPEELEALFDIVGTHIPGMPNEPLSRTDPVSRIAAALVIGGNGTLSPGAKTRGMYLLSHPFLAYRKEHLHDHD